jgi:hypothetical protein
MMYRYRYRMSGTKLDVRRNTREQGSLRPARDTPSKSFSKSGGIYFSFRNHIVIVVVVVIVGFCLNIVPIAFEESLVNTIGARCQELPEGVKWRLLQEGSGRFWLIMVVPYAEAQHKWQEECHTPDRCLSTSSGCTIWYLIIFHGFHLDGNGVPTDHREEWHDPLCERRMGASA